MLAAEADTKIEKPCAPNIPVVEVAAPPIAASSPGINAWLPWVVLVDFACLINFTIPVGLRAAAVLGSATDY